MRIVMFYHSLASDWNNGNAHFLRGVVTELQARGHTVRVLEPEDGWSRKKLLAEHGSAAISRFNHAYPNLQSHTYRPESLDLARELEGADLVLVHEWNEHSLVEAIGRRRAQAGGFSLLFHDTHHRSVTEPESMAAYRLGNYDGVLAFGEVVRRRYLEEGWARRAWTWHEAADVRLFRPPANRSPEGDVVWIGNWGDEERSAELEQFLIAPVAKLRLRATVHGVRYPASALRRLSGAGIEYAGWLPNFDVPKVFANYKATLHIPRLPYVQALPGIPTIRVFEALACGIPLVSAPWDDAEKLFSPGSDYLLAGNGTEMQEQLQYLLSNPEAARRLAEQGRKTILARHTCGHRVNELFAILEELNPGSIDGAARPTDLVEIGP